MLENTESRTKFGVKDIDFVSSLFFKAFSFEEKGAAQSAVRGRIKTLTRFIESINELLANRLVEDAQERLSLIDLLDKLITQKEAFEMSLMNTQEIENLRTAAKNFARKAQSSVS